MKVFKYSLPWMNIQFIDLPIGARPIHFDTQGDCVCLWVEADPYAEQVQREIFCVATGVDIPVGKTHLGTLVLPNDDVYHYYW